jgi:hypothetical protein
MVTQISNGNGNPVVAAATRVTTDPDVKRFIFAIVLKSAA